MRKMWEDEAGIAHREPCRILECQDRRQKSNRIPNRWRSP